MPFSCPSASFCFLERIFKSLPNSLCRQLPHNLTVPFLAPPPPRYLWWLLRLPSPQTLNDMVNDDEMSSVMSTVKIHKVTRLGEQSHLAGHCSSGRISRRQRHESMCLVWLWFSVVLISHIICCIYCWTGRFMSPGWQGEGGIGLGSRTGGGGVRDSRQSEYRCSSG